MQRQFDNVDRVSRATDAFGQWRDYQYDANGNPVSETLVAGNAQIDSNAAQYDAADRRIQSLDAAGNGNLTQKCEGTGVTGTSTSCTGSVITTLTWNPLDQLIAVTKTGVPNETYQYDPQGRRISKTVGAVTTHYRYTGDDIDAEYTASWNQTARYVHGAGVDDPLMRLTGATANPDAQTRYYAQDGLGSVVAYFGDIALGAAVIATSVTATNSYNATTYPPANLIDGDTSGTSVWGGNLASGPASFTLELGAVRPVSRLTLYKANFGSSYNVKDVQVQIRNGGIWSSVGGLTNNTADNPEIVLTNASGDAIQVIIQSAQSGTAAFMAEVSMVYDGGAQTVATQRFDAWGNKTQSAGAAIPQYGYTGREPDATGLVFYRARYYDPSIGRFIGRDPIGLSGGLNQYSYVGNDPTNSTDPSGLGPETLLKYLEKGIKVVNKYIETHPITGIPFKNSFPDFSDIATHTVKIEQTGKNVVDFAKANKAAGLTETPKGFTWHHVEDGTTMQLVPSKVHGATGHTGGAALARATAAGGGAAAAGNAEASNGGLLGTNVTWRNVGEFLLDFLIPGGVGNAGGAGSSLPNTTMINSTASGAGKQSLPNSANPPLSGAGANGFYNLFPRSK